MLKMNIKFSFRISQVYFLRYNGQWYTALLHTQKLILFLMQKNAKDFTLNVGGLFIESLDCFASVKDIIYHHDDNRQNII